VSLDRRGSGQSDSVGCETRHCASKDTLSEPDLTHVCKCVLGRQQGQERLIHSYVHLERKSRVMEMKMEALDEGFKGTSFHGEL
jgi:hypothetical protein